MEKLIASPAPARLAISEVSQAAQARRVATAMAKYAGLDETRTGELAIAVTEAGRNLAIHARSGELLLNWCNDARGRAVEMFALDHGPGMDLERCLEDGYSTAGTMGAGLGAIRRLATVFDATSNAKGTVLYARFEAEDSGSLLPTAVAAAPMPGESVCGDGAAAREAADGVALLMVDGLGHGAFAAEASATAIAAFQALQWRDATSALEALHVALRSTRGAAAAIAYLDPRARTMSYAGLGNISGTIYRPGSSQHLVSHNGTAGHSAARTHSFQYSWGSASLFVLHSDGINSRWNLDAWPGILRCHPGVLAGALFRDFQRGRDDATVLVALLP